MTDLHDPLGRLVAGPPAQLLVVGKGGVGKTTVAAAIACAIAAAGHRCDLLSVDPAHSLGDALDAPLPRAGEPAGAGGDPAPVPALPLLRAAELDPRATVRAWIAERRAPLATLLRDGSPLDADEVEALLDGEWPGLDEIAALLHLAGRGDAAAPLVVDTAPTGHALRLLDAPALADGWIATLAAMNDRRRLVRDALAPQGGDAVDALVAALGADVAAVAARLADPRTTRALVVTLDEPVALAETERLRRELARRGVALAGIVVNRVAADGHLAAATPLITRWRDEGVLVGTRARRAHGPRGAAALVAFAADADAPPPADQPAAGAATEDGSPGAPPLSVPSAQLHLVLGKGGVGKTTVASALALLLAERSPGARVALVSVDPAGSLGDVWEAAVGDEPLPAPGAPAVLLRQPDTAAHWERLREEAAAEIARVLQALDERRLAGADGEVVASLLRLVPPGMDELMGVLALIAEDSTHDYDFVVVDTAPTGHALRLLDVPERAGAWVQAMMRVLLRLRPLIGLGPFAERLVELSRALRAFSSLLVDPTRTHVVVVTRPEPLVAAETVRLQDALRARGLPAATVVVNAWEPGRDAAEVGAPDAVVAPRLASGPRGAEALRRFTAAWRDRRRRAVQVASD